MTYVLDVTGVRAMPRKLRVEYEGAIYHLMNRGDRREVIFLVDADRELFLETLGEACRRTGWQVHALCLMSNHFHLVVETPRANLIAGMQWFLGTYTTRFKRRHKLCGHLFSGRYKSLLVDGSTSGYLKTVCDYVHLNPVRAKLLKPEQPLNEYPWSSWPEYLKKPSQRWEWLRVDRLLGEWGVRQEMLELIGQKQGPQHYGEELKESDVQKVKRVRDTAAPACCSRRKAFVASVLGSCYANSVKTTFDIAEAQAQLPKLVRAKQTVTLRQADETVAFLVPRDRMEALLETMEIVANPEAMKAIRRDQSGKGKYLPLSVLDED
jgi:REP element-mobilizing transposase RayT